MDSTTLFTVFLCGHHTVELIDNLDDRKYFICYQHGACSSLWCADTDNSWFREHLKPVPYADHQRGIEMHSQMYTLFDRAQSALVAYDEIPGVDALLIGFVCQPWVDNLFLAESRGEALKRYLDTELLLTVGRCLSMSEHDISRRPLYDFCQTKLREHLHSAIEKVDSLEQVVGVLQQEYVKRAAIDQTTPSMVRIQPDASDYDKSFGKTELQMLKQAGAEGQSLLDSPISDASIIASENIVNRMRARMLLGGAAVDEGSPSASANDIDQFLKAFENEFRAETAYKRRLNAAKGRSPLKRLAGDRMKVDTHVAMKACRLPFGAHRGSV